ncbi:DUF3160 domain-containing protein [archaeon]|nr:MAG: DUF3160 domain-containing protein [archaeon]
MRNVIFAFMLLCSLLLAGCISSDTPSGDVGPLEISAREDPGFSSYEPVDVSYDPDTEPYDFDPVNADIFSLSPEQASFLQANGFVCLPSSSDVLFHEYYQSLARRDIPIFVTTDSVLHSYHILFDYSLRLMEQDVFYDDIITLTADMQDTMLSFHDQSEGPTKDAARLALGFFTVALQQLDPSSDIPDAVRDDVNAELALIDAADGIAYSPLFGYREDYSQYVPRGHYTRTEHLGDYFRAMMWYGRMPMRLKDATETRAAILTVLAMEQLSKGEGSAYAVWDAIYQTTSFYVGQADDPTLYDYAPLIEDVYGDTVELDALNDEAVLSSFRELAATQLPDPRINSSVLTDKQDLTDDTKGLRYMGQRFIIDSYVFSELVYDNVTAYTGDGDPMPFTAVPSAAGYIRGFPRGLDAMSVFGNEQATTILADEGDTDYLNYDTQWEKLREEVDAYTIDDWTATLYNAWLYCLEAYSSPNGEGYPSFMQSDAWEKKELYTALGSWTQLRHDTILYAKQSYTFEATSAPVVSRQGYVEPNIDVYARLLSLTRMTQEGLRERGLLLDEFDHKFDAFDTLLEELIDISKKELEGMPLSEQERLFIDNFGDHLEHVSTFSESIGQKVSTEADDSVALVADVHTDVNTQRVLEEGVGYPFSLLVVVEVEGTTYITQGPMFSYYEFKHPLSDRLTDEKWQSMLSSHDTPELPAWADFIR